MTPITPPRVQESADIDDRAAIGAETLVWHLARVGENAVVGDNCVIGRGAYVGPGVVIGDRCNVADYALIYEPAFVERGSFIGPAVVFTNDRFPRAVTPDGELKSADDWEPVGVHVGEGASIGARAVCVAPVRIGRWAMVAAGAVVTRDVPDFALVAGAPARQLRWVGHAGLPLEKVSGRTFRCPATDRRYFEWKGRLEEEALAEEPKVAVTRV